LPSPPISQQSTIDIDERNNGAKGEVRRGACNRGGVMGAAAAVAAAHEDRRPEAWVQGLAPDQATIDSLWPGSSLESQSSQPNISSTPSESPPTPSTSSSPENSEPFGIEHLKPRGPPTYSAASSTPIAEEPPNDTAITQFLLAISTQAKRCLSQQKKRKSAIGHPEDILRIISGNAPTSELQSFFFGVNNIPENGDIFDNMSHFASACAAAETTEGLIHLVYYLNAIKFACLATR